MLFKLICKIIRIFAFCFERNVMAMTLNINDSLTGAISQALKELYGIEQQPADVIPAKELGVAAK